MEMELPLYPVPDEEWQAEFDRLLRADAYLRKKYNREARVIEHRQYITQNCPEIITAEPGLVVDLGLGAGELLEFARAFGHRAIGIDAPTGEGGMGNGYLRLSKLMHVRQKLDVDYTGGPAFFRELAKLSNAEIYGDMVLLSARGSWAQCWAKYVGGPPHHINHDCTQQYWIWSDRLRVEWRRAFRAMFKHLRPGGCVLIAANRLGERTNQQRYDSEITATAEAAGFESVKTADSYVHKWRKPE